MVCIRIENLRVDTVVGTYPHEQAAPQTVLVTVELRCDTERACETDDLQDAVDYETLSTRIRDLGASSRCQLVEHFAAGILDLVMGDPRVAGAVVRVKKPSAIPDCDGVEVEVNSSR